MNKDQELLMKIMFDKQLSKRDDKTILENIKTEIKSEESRLEDTSYNSAFSAGWILGSIHTYHKVEEILEKGIRGK